MRSRERNERNTGGAIPGDGEGGWGRKKKEIAVDPREVPSNFSAVDAPTHTATSGLVDRGVSSATAG